MNCVRVFLCLDVNNSNNQREGGHAFWERLEGGKEWSDYILIFKKIANRRDSITPTKSKQKNHKYK